MNQTRQISFNRHHPQDRCPLRAHRLVHRDHPPLPRARDLGCHHCHRLAPLLCDAKKVVGEQEYAGSGHGDPTDICHPPAAKRLAYQIAG